MTSNLFYSGSLYALTMGLVAATGLLHLWFWQTGRRQPEHLWAAGWSFCCLLLQAGRWIQTHASEPELAILGARSVAAAAPLLALCLVAFARSLRVPPVRPASLPFVATTVGLAAVALGTDLFFTREIQARTDWFGQSYLGVRPGPGLFLLIPFCVAAFGYAARIVHRTPNLHDAERRVVQVTVTIFLVAGVQSVASAQTRVVLPPLVAYAPAVVALGLSYILVHRHSRLQQQLEQAVEDRTREIGDANQRLAESEARYRRLVEHSPLGVIACDAEGRVIAINARILEMLGAPNADVAKAINMLSFPPLEEAGIAAAFRDCLESGESQTREVEYTSLWGHDGVFRMNTAAIRDVLGRITGVQGIVEDIGDVRRLEHEVRQSQKMQALGHLAAGVAHEINNPMAFVRSNLRMLEQEWLSLAKDLADRIADPDLDHRLAEGEELIAESLQGVDRTIAIVRDVNEFGNAGDAGREHADLNEIVESASRMATASARGEVDWQHRYGELPSVWCAPSRLRQVFLNLLVNACHAVGEQGTVMVETLLRDGHVVVRVSDDGTGIAPEHLDHLFEPFFTTKAAGEGTGLGLYVSWEIVRMHDGDIKVESRPGFGTTFEVLLPLDPRGRSRAD